MLLVSMLAKKLVGEKTELFFMRITSQNNFYMNFVDLHWSITSGQKAGHNRSCMTVSQFRTECIDLGMDQTDTDPVIARSI